MNKYLRKGLKILLWTIASIVLLVILIALSLNIPAVQNFVKDRAITYLKNKTKTEVRLESIKIALPKDVVLNKFYIEDQKKDTLLYAEKLQVDISLFKLLKNTVEINNIELKKIRAHVKRVDPVTTFNFSFLVDAFMTEQKKPEETNSDSSSTLKFSVDKALFQDIGLTYHDDVAGNDVKLYLGEFKARVKDFDLKNQHYVIKTLGLKNTSLNYLQQKPLTQLAQHLKNTVDSSKKTTGKLPLIEIQDFAFNNVKINYEDQLSTTKAIADLNDLGLVNLKVNLTNGNYSADDARLNNSKVLFAFKPAPSNNLEKVKDTVLPGKAAFSLALKNISLKNNSIQYDNLAAKPVKGLDFNHLNISELQLGGGDINFSNGGITAKVKNGSFKEKSGFVLNELKGDAVYNDKQIKLSNFVVRTPNTNIENATELNFTSIDDLTKHPEKVQMQLSLKNTTIGLKDAFFFSNAIPAAYRNEKIKINANVNGTLSNLSIPQLQISGLKNTNIDISGSAKGLPDINKTFLDLKIKRLSLTKGDLLVVIPKKALPPTINLPNAINANGIFRGSMTDFTTNLNVQTDMGGAQLNATMKGPKGRERYNAKVNLINFNVGRLIKQPTVGRISARANVTGSGLDPKTINAKFDATVSSAQYNNYTYRNLNLSGNYINQLINIKGSMPDSNANFNLDARINLAGKYPSVKANVNLKQIDLQRLNFSKTELRIAGNIKADLTTADVDYLNGSVFATKLQLVKDGKRFNVDTIQLEATSNSTSNTLNLKSELLSAKLEGKYQLTKIGNAVINQINKYYQFGEVVSIPDQRVKFAVNIYNPKFLKDFVPQLTTFVPSTINGLIDTRKDSLILNANFPKVVYDTYNVDSIRLAVNNNNQQLNYDFTIKSIQSPSIALFRTEISGKADNNQLDLNIFLRDRQRKDRYMIGGVFRSINKDFRFNIDPNKLLLDYEKWTVAPENFIQFGKSGILANQFNLSEGGQLLSINSTNNVPNSPIRVEFKNFQIETLTKFAETDTTLVGGTINGQVDVKDLFDNPKFEANLTVNKLRYQKDELGDLSLAINNNRANAFQVDAQLKGVHQLRASGYYYTAPQSALDLTVNIDKIDLREIESMSMGQIRQGKGTVTGQFSVKGELTAPKILGAVKFNNAGFNVAYINSYFTMPDQEIRFSNEGIRFNNFTLIDSLNKKAVVDGMIYTSDFKNVRFNLDVRTDNFRALNSTAADNDMIYGTVFITSNIKIRGDMNQPDVNMNVTIDKGTKFFYAIPIFDPSVIDQEGIVQFIDADAPPYNGEKALKVDSVSKSPIKGLNLVAAIKVDPDAELNVVVDPSNGDLLNVKGDADLNASIDPSGKISLTGRYEITDGSYSLSVGPFAKKQFKLVKGSSIVWTGEPTSATVNLTALYEVMAAPIDLVNEPDNVYLKTKLPFQVYLYMKDELLKPTISFKIDLPESYRSTYEAVYTKLQNVNRDPNDLNKQVFALLALNRFIANNPFQSLAGGGGGVSTLARSSVSKLLTEQLNNLASDLIQGVDINFGVNSSEDYSTGSLEQRTDLEVGLSKKLLNDRLTVTVGSSFGLEGPKTPNTSSSNIAGNVNIDYLLSADGRYRLRFYRRNQNEGIVEGQIIETGLGFTLVVDYNKFREIFESRKKKMRKQMEQKPNNETTN